MPILFCGPLRVIRGVKNRRYLTDVFRTCALRVPCECIAIWLIFDRKQPAEARTTWCKASFSCWRKAKEGIFYLLAVWGGGRGLPEKIFEKRMQMVHSEPIFAEFVSIFYPKILCNFCFQISDLLYTWCGKNFHLSCRGKAKEGIFFYLLAVGGGGGRGLPEKIFEKRMQMVHSEPIFAEFVSISTPKNCV